MNAETVLSRLDRVKRTGTGRWQARCPSHDDQGPSLAVRELEDGRVLVHCFAGCDVYSVLSSVSLGMSDLFPERSLSGHLNKGERRPFPAADVLRSLAFEASVVVIVARSIFDGTLCEQDRQRCLLAAGRIDAALDAAGVRHYG